jgi:hypothetical protein
MKKSILLSFFIIVTTIVSSQVITVKLDTTQYFEHSALLSTPQAIEYGKLVYTELYEHKPNFVMTFNFSNMTESFDDYVFNITKVNESTNIIDVVVDEDGQDVLVVLGKTEEGGIMYIMEYRDGDLIKGYFSKNPEIIYN